MSVLKFIRKTAIFAVCTGLFAVCSIFLSQSVGAVSYVTSTTVDDLYSLSNQERTEAGLIGLNLNDQLNSAAQSKANHMLSNNYWAHYAPDGTTPWSFIVNAGYRYSSSGENLAKGFSTSDGVVEGWMASSTHKANVLGAYTDVGYAVVDGKLLGSETTLVVAMYGIRTESVVAPASVATTSASTSAPAPTPTPTLIPPVTTTPQINFGVKEAIITNQTESIDVLKVSVLAVSLVLIFVAIRYKLNSRKEKHSHISLRQRPISVIVNN